MKRKERLKSLFSELVDLLIPDEQINAVTPENTMPDPPKDPVRPLERPPIAETEDFKVVAARVAAKVLGAPVPEKLQRLASGTVKTFCPECGMPMSGGTCRECTL